MMALRTAAGRREGRQGPQRQATGWSAPSCLCKCAHTPLPPWGPMCRAVFFTMSTGNESHLASREEQCGSQCPSTCSPVTQPRLPTSSYSLCLDRPSPSSFLTSTLSSNGTTPVNWTRSQKIEIIWFYLPFSPQSLAQHLTHSRWAK